MQPTPAKPRLISIDQFRGLAILLMILANFMGSAQSVPSWLKHAHDIGLTIIDLIAPFFIFAIGLTYGLSLRRRVTRDGWTATALHFIRRWMALVGIGTILSVGETTFVNPGKPAWGVLQAIGVAGLLTLPTLRLPPWGRALTGLGLLAVYQVLLDRFWLANVLGAPHGGMMGALGWSAMLILSTVLADVAQSGARGRKAYLWLSLGVTLAGTLLALVVPVSKNRVSASYVLISLGLSALLYALFYVLCDQRGYRSRLLDVWGQNPLALYFLHYLVLAFFVLPPIPIWQAQAPLWLIVIKAAALLAILSWLGVFFQRRGWVLTL